MLAKAKQMGLWGTGTGDRGKLTELRLRYPDTIFLFADHEAYVAFDEDAEIVSKVCGAVWINKWSMTRLSKIHLDTHIAKLINAGHRVGIVEEIGNNPEVMRIITPGGETRHK